MRSIKRERMYVSRHSSSPGWLVQIGGEKTGKYFSDGKHGGRRQAHSSAIRYATRITDRKRVNRKNGRWLHRRPSSGVFRFVNVRKPNKPAIWIAVACPELGKPKRPYFYVTKYGEKRAKQLAHQARAGIVRQILE